MRTPTPIDRNKKIKELMSPRVCVCVFKTCANLHLYVCYRIEADGFYFSKEFSMFFIQALRMQLMIHNRTINSLMQFDFVSSVSLHNQIKLSSTSPLSSPIYVLSFNFCAHLPYLAILNHCQCN